VTFLLNDKKLSEHVKMRDYGRSICDMMISELVVYDR